MRQVLLSSSTFKDKKTQDTEKEDNLLWVTQLSCSRSRIQIQAVIPDIIL